MSSVTPRGLRTPANARPPLTASQDVLITRMMALSMDCMNNLHEAIFLHLVDNKDDFYFVAAVANDCHAFFFALKRYMSDNHTMLEKHKLDFREVAKAFRDGGDVAVMCMMESLFQVRYRSAHTRASVQIEHRGDVRFARMKHAHTRVCRSPGLARLCCDATGVPIAFHSVWQDLPALFDSMFTADEGEEDVACETVIMTLQDCLTDCQDVLIKAYFKSLLQMVAEEVVVAYFRALYKPAMNVCRNFYLQRDDTERLAGFIFHLKTCFMYYQEEQFYDKWLHPSLSRLDEFVALINAKHEEYAKVFSRVLKGHKMAPMACLMTGRLCLEVRQDMTFAQRNAAYKACVQLAVKVAGEITEARAVPDTWQSEPGGRVHAWCLPFPSRTRPWLPLRAAITPIPSSVRLVSLSLSLSLCHAHTPRLESSASRGVGGQAENFQMRDDLFFKAFPVSDVPDSSALAQSLGGQMPFYDFLADDEKKREKMRKRYVAATQRFKHSSFRGNDSLSTNV